MLKHVANISGESKVLLKGGLMSNRNQKITNFNPNKKVDRSGFTKDEKTTLFMTLGQIAMDLDRLVRASNIKIDENEDFYDRSNAMVTDACYSLIEGYYPDLAIDNDGADDEKE